MSCSSLHITDQVRTATSFKKDIVQNFRREHVLLGTELWKTISRSLLLSLDSGCLMTQQKKPQIKTKYAAKGHVSTSTDSQDENIKSEKGKRSKYLQVKDTRLWGGETMTDNVLGLIWPAVSGSMAALYCPFKTGLRPSLTRHTYIVCQRQVMEPGYT